MINRFTAFLKLYRIHDKFNKLVWIKDFKKIIEFAEEVKNIFPNRPIGYFYCGYGKLKISKYEDSIKDFHKTLDLLVTRNNRSEKKFFLYYSYLNLCSAYDVLGEYEKSLAYVEKAIEVNKNKYEGYLNRGIIRMKTDNKNRVLSDFDKVLVLDKNNLIASRNRESLIIELLNPKEVPKRQ